HDRAAEADGDGKQVEVPGHQLPRPPREQRARKRNGDGRRRRCHQPMFLVSMSANFLRNSRALSLPTSACWNRGTPSESSLPPHPAYQGFIKSFPFSIVSPYLAYAGWAGTPSESSLPPHPAYARYGLTIENGNDLMKHW